MTALRWRVSCHSLDERVNRYNLLKTSYLLVNREDFPTESLRIFDRMDLDDLRQRRIATYALEDYYGTILSLAGGVDCLDYPDSVKGLNVLSIWKVACDRFRSIEPVDIPDKHYKSINYLHRQRRSIAHDYTKSPDTSKLQFSRNNAKDWTDWFETMVDGYCSHRRKQSNEQILIDSLKRMVEDTISSPDSIGHSDLEYDQHHINKRAHSILSKIDHLKNLDPDSGEYKRNLSSIVGSIAEIYQAKNTMISEQRVRQYTADSHYERNFVSCRLLDSKLGEPGEVLVKTFGSTNSGTKWIDLNPLPRNETEKLEDLDIGDTFDIRYSSNPHGEKYISEIRTD